MRWIIRDVTAADSWCFENKIGMGDDLDSLIDEVEANFCAKKRVEGGRSGLR